MKEFSLNIINLIESYNIIKIPRLNINKIEDINIISEESNKREITSNILTYLGIYILGISSIIFVMIASDYIAPELTRSVPYVGNMLDIIYNSFHSIYNWWFNKPTPPSTPAVDPGNTTGYWNRPILPSSVTRSNSSDSNITIRDLRIDSPGSPITPPSTPDILDRDYSEDLPSNW